MLSSDAVPTIFDFAVNSTIGTKVQRKAPKKRSLSMEDDLPEASSAIPKKKRLCYFWILMRQMSHPPLMHRSYCRYPRLRS
ncbi:hypothetical protein JTE90_024687 [Oedothorax gibbosus]|uniref:Uncharacterized protein n=1 Tax=Oedothorax gibbosus TaxID=931172 RepID=A0AAV6U9B9_9ARAC|nr:hypothetical protein JTE90_024687 [Oedothorax gibbosus]